MCAHTGPNWDKYYVSDNYGAEFHAPLALHDYNDDKASNLFFSNASSKKKHLEK